MKRLLIGAAIIAAILVLLVKLGELKLSLFSGGVTASEVSIGDDPKFSPGPFLSAQAVTVGVDLPALIFSRELHVKRISIDQPDITLLEDPMGAWNFSTLGSATTTTTPSSSNEAALDR